MQDLNLADGNRGLFSDVHLIKRFDELERNRRLGRCYDGPIEHALAAGAADLGLSEDDARGIVKGFTPRAHWSGLHDLECLLYAIGDDLRGVRVLDLGCGSNQADIRFGEWRPYMAVALGKLGADVIGIDYRPSHSSDSPAYRHIQGDICDADRVTRELAGYSFDLVIARSLSEGGLIDESRTAFATLEAVSGTAKMLLTDLSPVPERFQSAFAWNREEGSNRFYLA